MAVYDKFGSVRTDDKVTDDKPISALLLVDVRRSKTPLPKSGRGRLQKVVVY